MNLYFESGSCKSMQTYCRGWDHVEQSLDDMACDGIVSWGLRHFTTLWRLPFTSHCLIKKNLLSKLLHAYLKPTCSEVHMVKTFYLVFREVSLVQQGLSLLLQDLLRGGLRGLRGRDLLIQRLPWYKQGLPIPHQLSWNQSVKRRKRSSVMH